MITSFDLIKILRDKVGEEQAAALTNYVEMKVHEEFESKKDGFATKDDIHSVREDIARLEIKIESTANRTLIWLFAMLVTFFSLALVAVKFIK